MAIVGQLEVQLMANVATLRTDLEKARGHLDTFSKNATRAVGFINTAFGALAGVGAASWAASFIKSSIEAQASLKDLSERTSVAVETLSGMHQVARLSGTAMDSVAAFAQKLAKNMAAAAGGNNDLAATFQRLGIELRSADGSLRNVGDVSIELAKKLAGARDQTAALAYAQQLGGKAAADLMPYFKDLAEQGRLQEITTTAQAEAADKLQKDWAKLSQQSDILKNDLAAGLVPALGKVIAEFNEARRVAGSFFGALNLAGDERSPGESLRDIRRKMEELNEIRSRGALGGIQQQVVDIELEQLRKKKEFNEWRQRQLALESVKPGEIYDAREGFAQQMDVSGELPPISRSANDAFTKEQQRVWKIFADGWVAVIDEQIRVYEDGLKVLAQLAENGSEADVRRFKEDHEKMQDMMKEGRQRLQEEQERGERDAREQLEAVREYAQEFGSAFEDAIVNGKKFSDVMRTLVKDIGALAIRKNLTEPLMEALTAMGKGGGGGGAGGLLGSLAGFFGGGSGGGGGFMPGEYINAYADGGRPPVGVASLVGERGPELFVPDVAGAIVPNHAMGGGGVSIVQNIRIDARSDQASIRAAMLRAKDQAKTEILESFNRGLEFSRAAARGS